MHDSFKINNYKDFFAHLKNEIKKEILICEDGKRYTHRLHLLESCMREYEKALFHLEKAKKLFIQTERK